MRNGWLIAAGVCGAVAVGLGAYGAHGLHDRLVSLGHSEIEASARIRQRFEPAVLYHLVHAVALGLLATLSTKRSTACVTVAGAAFVLGILLFSGLLYILTFADLGGLGAMVPVGGLAYIIGWITLAVYGWRCGGGT